MGNNGGETDGEIAEGERGGKIKKTGKKKRSS
jgi:hypothetical protein